MLTEAQLQTFLQAYGQNVSRHGEYTFWTVTMSSRFLLDVCAFMVVSLLYLICPPSSMPSSYHLALCVSFLAYCASMLYVIGLMCRIVYVVASCAMPLA